MILELVFLCISVKFLVEILTDTRISSSTERRRFLDLLLTAVRPEKACSHRYDVENGSKISNAFIEMTGYSCFAEIQNLSSDTWLNLTFKVRLHCSSLSSSSSRRQSIFSVHDEKPEKGFLTQSYVFHDKEGKCLSSFSGSDPK